MTTFLRRTTTKGLVLFFVAVTAMLSVGAIVATGAASDGAKPAPKPLAEAIQSSLSGNGVEGVTARIKFTNRLIDSSAVMGASDPLLGGGSGRMWADKQGNLRIELQSDGGGGDIQVVARDGKVWVSHPGSGEVYTATLPKGGDQADGSRKGKAGETWPPTLQTVKGLITRLTGDATLSEATPDNVGGRPAYTVSINPKDKGGLVGGADVSWDARNGALLGFSIRAKGSSDPVLAVEATDVSFGPVDESVFNMSPPAGAKVTDLTTELESAAKRAEQQSKSPSRDRSMKNRVTGLAAVQSRVAFKISAPKELAGLSRSEVVLVGSGADAAAVITYGTGLGSVVVIERSASAKKQSNAQANTGEGDGQGLSLPTVDIGGAKATALPTALGTGLQFERDGVSYTVFGSVGQATAEALARGL